MAYIASQHTTVSKPLGVSGTSTDARSNYYDATLFRYRDYISTAEVLSYLATAANRRGGFPIFINSTGTLDNGIITGGTREIWWFRNGVADGDLVKMEFGVTDYNDLENLPALFSGDYDDLSNKPTIPDSLSDLSEDSTHRVVTDAEKSTWNGKQDALGFTAANDDEVVHKIGAEDISGVKTFLAPTNDTILMIKEIGNLTKKSEFQAGGFTMSGGTGFSNYSLNVASTQIVITNSGSGSQSSMYPNFVKSPYIVLNTQGGSFTGSIESASLTANRNYVLPNLGGTFTMLTQDQDIEITDSSKGIILKDSGDGTRRRITCVNGVLTVSSPL